MTHLARGLQDLKGFSDVRDAGCLCLGVFEDSSDASLEDSADEGAEQNAILDHTLQVKNGVDFFEVYTQRFQLANLFEPLDNGQVKKSQFIWRVGKLKFGS